MEKDILSLFIANEDFKTIAKKIYRLALITLTGNIIYSLLELFEWYNYLNNSSTAIQQHVDSFYIYKVRPIVSILIIALSIIGNLLNYQGYGKVLKAIKTFDPILFKKGFENFYITYVLAALTFIIAIASISYRFLK